VKPGDLVLASFNEFGNVGEAGFGSFVHVLVAQNQTYVRYLGAYNKAQFQQIRNQELYLAANVALPNTGAPVKPSDNGAITIKSAWIDMTNVAQRDRFYTRPAWLQNPKTLVCSKGVVGLVGLHIVQKTPSRPQWIWSTFEHIDNVPGPSSPAGQAFTLNKGDGKPMPLLKDLGKEYRWGTAPEVPAPAFNVQRVTPIAAKTADTNTTWQDALKVQGSVWQFYQLVTTQWPVPGNAPNNQGTNNFTTPRPGRRCPPRGPIRQWKHSTRATQKEAAWRVTTRRAPTTSSGGFRCELAHRRPRRPRRARSRLPPSRDRGRSD
jgi:hypothetical protein